MIRDLTLNSHRFILFSVFFTARAYYPVLAILFIDLGLTLDQFVMLNFIWAITIFLFEVPSGALADTIGRRYLLIAASVLMLIEMLCLLFASFSSGATVLALCILNRICSGLSEACASGADEALAYDSLPEQNRTLVWDQLLEKVMRWRSVGFVLSMIIGGLLYDPAIINYILNERNSISEDMAHRLPVILVLVQACVCIWVTLRMVEPAHAIAGAKLVNTFNHILTTARWAFTTPRVLVVILIGVAVDSIVRNFATINSSYYRLIEVPEWTYGLLGALFGVMGFVIPTLAKFLNEKFSLLTNLVFIVLGTLVGLIALIPAWPVYGLIPAICVFSVMFFLGFTVSRVLHEEAESARRATVLSVKGLIFNLGYGLFSLVFSMLLTYFPASPEGSALRSALLWQVPFFALVTFVLLIWARIALRKMHK